MRPVHLLLIEDNPGDARLIQEALAAGAWVPLVQVIPDGSEALAYLQQVEPYQAAVRPDLILLDLKLLGTSGMEVLAEVKAHPDWKHIPVIILTSSSSEVDMLGSYELHANCYLVKPEAWEGYLGLARALESFWMGFAKLPGL